MDKSGEPQTSGQRFGSATGDTTAEEMFREREVHNAKLPTSLDKLGAKMASITAEDRAEHLQAALARQPTLTMAEYAKALHQEAVAARAAAAEAEDGYRRRR